jgi:phosphoglycolate phosphatase-like HAD superfamily hydrolase
MFDVDGTLVNSAGFDAELYAEAARSVLRVEVDEDWHSYRQSTDSGILAEILERAGLRDPNGELQAAVKRRFIELTRAYLSRHCSVVREIPGAKVLLEELQETPGYRVAIATGGWVETAALKLRQIGIEPTGLPFATASDATARARIMQIAEQRALRGAPAANRTYFGDKIWDKNASAELGYRFVAIGRGVEHEVIFDDYADRAAILRRLIA